MSTYRVDYITECGQRGEWHCDIDNYDGLEAQCRNEIEHIAQDLERRTDKRLKELVIVKLSEEDIHTFYYYKKGKVES